MPPTTAPHATTAPVRSPLMYWLAVVSVSVGTFSIITSEMLPVGLLTPIGDEFHVSSGTAGLMVTVTALVAAVAAPLLTVASGRIDRRLVLLAMMGLLAAANLVASFASNFPVMLLARVLVGTSVGGFWALAAGLAIRLVPAQAIPRATAMIFGGISLASVLGVPAGVFISDLAGWRTALISVAALCLAVLVAMVFLLPSLPAPQAIKFAELPRLFGSAPVRIGLLVTLLLVTGHFTAYTFVEPVLREVSDADPKLIGTLLTVYGVSGFVGNFVAGVLVGRNLRATVLGIAVGIGLATALIPVLGVSLVGVVPLMVLWGLCYGGTSVSLQIWMLRAAPKAPEASSALFVSIFHVAISLGALVGGRAADLAGTTSVMWIAGVLAALTALAVWRSYGARNAETGAVATG